MEKGKGVIELRDPLHKTQALQPPHDFRESIMFRPECRKVHAPLKNIHYNGGTCSPSLINPGDLLEEAEGVTSMLAESLLKWS